MSAAKSQSPSPIVKLAGMGILLIGLYYLHLGGQFLSDRINQLPVEGLSVAAPEEKATPNKAQASLSRESLHPLLVASRQKVGAVQTSAKPHSESAPEQLDGLFGRTEAQKEIDELKAAEKEAAKKAEAERKAAEKAAEQAAKKAANPAAVDVTPGIPAFELPDTFKMLASRVRVQAISAGGAIVNGSYVELGDEIKSLKYPSPDSKQWLTPTLSSVEGEVVLIAEPAPGKRKIQAKLIR